MSNSFLLKQLSLKSFMGLVIYLDMSLIEKSMLGTSLAGVGKPSDGCRIYVITLTSAISACLNSQLESTVNKKFKLCRYT